MAADSPGTAASPVRIGSGGRAGARTPTPCGRGTSSERVCPFRHLRLGSPLKPRSRCGISQPIIDVVPRPVRAPTGAVRQDHTSGTIRPSHGADREDKPTKGSAATVEPSGSTNAPRLSSVMCHPETGTNPEAQVKVQSRLQVWRPRSPGFAEQVSCSRLGLQWWQRRANDCDIKVPRCSVSSSQRRGEQGLLSINSSVPRSGLGVVPWCVTISANFFLR